MFDMNYIEIPESELNSSNSDEVTAGRLATRTGQRTVAFGVTRCR